MYKHEIGRKELKTSYYISEISQDIHLLWLGITCAFNARKAVGQNVQRYLTTR